VIDVTDERNNNLTPSQRELLKWHFRLGHGGFNKIKIALKSGVLGAAVLLQQASRVTNVHVCPSCQFGKAHRKSTTPAITPNTIRPPVATREHESLSNDILHPGQKISMDHFIVTQKGSSVQFPRTYVTRPHV
jgi:GAG-pre-integrase domain